MLLVAFVAAVALAACSHETPRPLTDATVTAATAKSTPALSQSEDVKTFTIGDLSAAALRDGALEFPNDNEIFGVGTGAGANWFRNES